MLVHTVFDLAAWISGGLMGWWVGRRGYLRPVLRTRTPRNDPGYFIALAIGAVAGALFFGTLNLRLAGRWQLGHSVIGAIVGGIVAVECFKLVVGIRGSTGAQFVAPLAVGITVGRLGCFMAGLADYTYGTPTSLPWGVDFGDGIPRHPVQLYEATAMLAFLVVYLRQIASGSAGFLRQGFYLFVGWYAAQRFVWEFLKPYPRVLGPFDVFQPICVVLLAYSLLMTRWNHEPHSAL